MTELDVNLQDPAMCLGCGCTDIKACVGGCSWLARAGETFQLSMKPIWVRPLAIAISVNQPAMEAP